MQRRSFLQTATLSTAGMFAAQTFTAQTIPAQQNESKNQTKPERLHIAVNQYAVNSFYQRENKNFAEQFDEMKSVGVDGLEPTVDNAQSLANLGKKLKDHGLEFRSVYVGGNLHEPEIAEKEMGRIRGIAEKAKELGSQIIIFNPAAKRGKNDAELILQAENVNKLGSELDSFGMKLAFHYHTTELEFAAREFHHLLCNTNPRYFSLCLEQHWSYRGSGNSQVALFDHLKLYGNRMIAVHLRQSVNHVWSETFGDGDIDNLKLAADLKTFNVPIHFVLEQATEKNTPKTLTADVVFRQSCEYIRRVFY
ncbi:MAG: sugar phosphate isomerase/epimerase [Planctomycetaceae bacterium]|jgi:inosose dehydratase|nr:sugar phosphate isomerase/epimerase [Planctomycetaceae bacterium]